MKGFDQQRKFGLRLSFVKHILLLEFVSMRIMLLELIL